jgi:hypothetical protein
VLLVDDELLLDVFKDAARDSRLLTRLLYDPAALLEAVVLAVALVLVLLFAAAGWLAPPLSVWNKACKKALMSCAKVESDAVLPVVLVDVVVAPVALVEFPVAALALLAVVEVAAVVLGARPSCSSVLSRLLKMPLPP